MFKTSLYTGAKVSPLYDPYVGKILTFAERRENYIKDMNNFLKNIIIKGIRTNLNFLRHILNSNCLFSGVQPLISKSMVVSEGLYVSICLEIIPLMCSWEVVHI